MGLITSISRKFAGAAYASSRVCFLLGDIKYSDLNKDLLLTDYLLSLLVASSPAIIDMATEIEVKICKLMNNVT